MLLHIVQRRYQRRCMLAFQFTTITWRRVFLVDCVCVWQGISADLSSNVTLDDNVYTVSVVWWLVRWRIALDEKWWCAATGRDRRPQSPSSWKLLSSSSTQRRLSSPLNHLNTSYLLCGLNGRCQKCLLTLRFGDTKDCLPMNCLLTSPSHSGLKWGVRWGVSQIWPKSQF